MSRPTARRATAHACRKTLAHKAKHAAGPKLSHTAIEHLGAAKVHAMGVPVARKAATKAHVVHAVTTKTAIARMGRAKVKQVTATGLKGQRVARATHAKTGC